MFKKVLSVVLFLLFLIIVPPAFYLIDNSATPNQASSAATLIGSDKVVYELPYPGILPDNPLYFVKIVRDRIVEFLTRENIKKAELYLLFSDKRAAAALELAQNGKDELAISTLSKGEKYFSKIPKLLSDSKKQGVSPSSDLISRLQLSNAKHREVAQTLVKDLPSGQNDEMNQILQLNSEIKKELNRL